MSFIHVPGPHYVKRSLVFVNSFDRVKQESSSGFEFTWALEEELQQVFSIELVQYSIPHSTAPTWIGKLDYSQVFRDNGVVVLNSTPTNTLTDILITTEDGLSSAILKSDSDQNVAYGYIFFLFFHTKTSISGFRPAQISVQRNLLERDIEGRFILLDHPVINESNYEVKWVYLNDLDEANDITTMVVENKGTPGSYATVEYLYATGTSKHNQTSRVWGFPPGVNSTPTASPENGARPSFPPTFTQFRYINVNLEEAPEFSPLARIYTTNNDEEDNYVNPCDIPRKTRIMKTPIRNMKRMRISLNAENGMQFMGLSDIGVLLVFEILSIQQVPKVPKWIVQRLSL